MGVKLYWMLLVLASTFAFSQETIKPWLGVSIDKGEHGVLVKGALPETPAKKAGINAMDEILSVDGKEVKTPEQLISEVASKGVGFTVTVEILRNKKKLSKQITLVARPDMMEMANKALLGQKAPEFEANIVKGIEGKKFHSKSFLGKVTVLEFWATWCPACVASYPRLIEFAEKNKGKINIITVSGEELPVVKKFLDKFSRKLLGIKNAPITYLQSTNGEVGSKYFASAIPMFILIDKKGIVSKLTVGGGTYLEELLLAAEKL